MTAPIDNSNETQQESTEEITKNISRTIDWTRTPEEIQSDFELAHRLHIASLALRAASDPSYRGDLSPGTLEAIADDLFDAYQSLYRLSLD
jgi:hypothetical protein